MTSTDFYDPLEAGGMRRVRSYAMVRWWLRPGRQSSWHVFREDVQETTDFAPYHALCELTVTEAQLYETGRYDFQRIAFWPQFIESEGACRLCVHEAKKLLVDEETTQFVDRYLSRAMMGMTAMNANANL